jgi:hypothetical protein
MGDGEAKNAEFEGKMMKLEKVRYGFSSVLKL